MTNKPDVIKAAMNVSKQETDKEKYDWRNDHKSRSSSLADAIFAGAFKMNFHKINKDVLVAIDEETAAIVLNINGQKAYLNRNEMVKLITFIMLDACKRFN